MSCRKSCLAVLLSVGVIGFQVLAQAQSFVSNWSASSGLLPDQASTYWQHYDNSAAPQATISNGVMTLTTLGRSQKDFFYFGPEGITMPENLTIEFKARLVSTVRNEKVFSPLSVYFCIGSGLGGAFYLGGDDVWLAGQNQSRAIGTAVDTDDAFHTFRIELTGSTIGSLINVYYDNSLTPLLSSPVVNDEAVYGDAPQIGMGDNSNRDSGVSEWEYLWHNAACVPVNAVPEPSSLALLTVGALLLGARKFPRRK